MDITTEDFRKFYTWLFSYNLEKKTNPVLNYEIVKHYFNEFFAQHFKIVSEFMEFYEKEKSNAPFKQDQWNCFLELLKSIGDQFPKNYTPEDFWPTLFDDFYEWFCKKHGIKIEKKEEY